MISIIIPIYNKAAYLKQCLESVQHQSCTDFECLMINNNSTDDSEEICKDFLFDSRFKLYNCEKQGVSAARNKGIKEAKGEWIIFIDADDWINSDFVETLYNTTKCHPGYKCYTCCGKTTYTDKSSINTWNNIKEGEHTKDEVENFKLGVRWATVWNAIWSTEVFKNENPIKFDENIYAGEDELVCIEYWLKYNKLYHISYSGYNHIINKTSISKLNRIYDNNSVRILCRITNILHKYNIENEELKKVILNIYETKVNVSDSIDYVVPYTTNNVQQIKNKIKNYTSYYYNDDEIYNTDEELLKRYNKEDKIFNMQIRSIAKYMPFIRMIHLIVEDETHVPDWIDKTKVHIVYHKDFIPSMFLPTYNSDTIECHLANIPFLANKIIYGNSDYIALKPFTSLDFFLNDYTRNKFVFFNVRAWQFAEICKTTYSTIFKKRLDNKYLAPIIHCFTPMITQRVKEVYSLYKKELYNSCTAFRSTKNINQYIYPFYDLLKEYVIFSNIKAYTVLDNLNKGMMQKANVICLEDMDDDNPIVKEVEEYTNFEKCKYEL